MSGAPETHTVTSFCMSPMQLGIGPARALSAISLQGIRAGSVVSDDRNAHRIVGKLADILVRFVILQIDPGICPRKLFCVRYLREVGYGGG